MPSKWNKDKRKKDYCRFCGGEIVLYPGTTQTWIHVDTGESQKTSPMLHNAYPRSHKKS